MAEGRSCQTCSHYLIDGCGDTKGCASLTGWQPIQKAPSFQMTEEEANIFYTDNLDIINVSRNEFISCLGSKSILGTTQQTHGQPRCPMK